MKIARTSLLFVLVTALSWTSLQAQTDLFKSSRADAESATQINRPAATLATTTAGEREAAGEYVIGVEDVLRIVVWGEPELTISVQVRPDGRITVPLVNDISVAGLRPSRVREIIAERLTAFIRDPHVTVIVEAINSFRVYFLGEVNLQGTLQFYRPTRLLQAISAAGGLTDFAKKELILLRQDGGLEKRFVIDYKRLIAGDPRQENLLLMPGDTVLVN